MPTEYDEDGAPIFGAGTADALNATRTFHIEAMHAPSGAVVRHTFTSYVDPGSGPIMAFMRAKGTQAQANASSRLIFDALVDDDGLPESYVVPADDPDSADPRIDDRDEWSSRRRFVDLVETEDWRIASTVLDDLADWITKTAMTRGGTSPRPTVPPAPSSPGRKTTRRGSTARRSTKAST